MIINATVVPLSYIASRLVLWLVFMCLKVHDLMCIILTTVPQREQAIAMWEGSQPGR